MKCVVPENVHTSPIEGHWKFQVLKGGLNIPKFLNKSMKVNWTFPQVWESPKKNLSWESGRGIWIIFSGAAQCYMMMYPGLHNLIKTAALLVKTKATFTRQTNVGQLVLANSNWCV